MVRSQQASTHIARLISEEGVEVKEGADILTVLLNFYRNLYAFRKFRTKRCFRSLSVQYVDPEADR